MYMADCYPENLKFASSLKALNQLQFVSHSCPQLPNLQEMKSAETTDDVEAFLVQHGAQIVDLIGGEIDRIEEVLRVSLFIMSFNFD